MALATENSNKVWQKVKIALQNAKPGNREAFLALKLYLATQKKNVDLQFIPFSAEDITANGGQATLDIPDGPYTLYGVYAKGRRTSGTTASFLSVNDADDNSATTATIVTAQFNVTGQEYVFILGDGYVGAADISIAAATTVGGATESSAADAADGFIIVGA
jgi:hypothetical protein